MQRTKKNLSVALFLSVGKLLSLYFIASALAQNSSSVSNSTLKPEVTASSLASIQLQNAFPNLRFKESLFLTHAGDGSNRIFVVEKGGVVYVFPDDQQASSAGKFLDISAKLSGVGETGLLSLAFHPKFAENKKFYISYVDKNLVSTVSEMLISSNPNQADLASERILLHMQQPQRNHNGGHIAFGPDGLLYIAFGDGHSEADGVMHGDPFGNGQNRANWFSALLRINVDQKQDTLEYAIPPDNPFVGNNQGWKEEIFAYGFRNPWRYSFDRSTGTLWLADVGDKKAEEIDLVESGKNYGWSLKEAFHCYEDVPCDTSLWQILQDPIYEYLRDLGESVTGGYVYRGKTHQSLQGLYIYGDFDFHKVWALEYKDGSARNVLDLTCPQNISSFGEDEAGEVYAVGYQGSIYRLVDNTTSVQQPPRAPAEFRLYPASPNPYGHLPFNPTCRIAFEVPRAEHVTITVFDYLGRRVAVLTNARYGQGQHVVTWSGHDDAGRSVASGVYVYVMEAGKFKKNEKMLLLR